MIALQKKSLTSPKSSASASTVPSVSSTPATRSHCIWSTIEELNVTKSGKECERIESDFVSTLFIFSPLKTSASRADDIRGQSLVYWSFALLGMPNTLCGMIHEV